MDYEKKYKELVAKIKNAHLYAQTDSTKNVLEGILPELAESEDERILEIIKHCIESRYLHTSTIKGISQKQCFAWLEKQGEQKPAWSEEDEEMFEYTISLLNYNLGCRKWLKSLRPQNTWKPSEELDEASYQVGIKRVLDNPESYGLTKYNWKPSDAQIRALEYIINNAHNTSYSCKIAKELLEQLKKLKGE